MNGSTWRLEWIERVVQHIVAYDYDSASMGTLMCQGVLIVIGFLLH